MNFNKGARTKGRGTSFKGALIYYLHDKDRRTSHDRVGFIELLNLTTDDPDQVWREMMATAEAGAALKVAAGIKATGRKNDKPVYCFSLEWHPDDKPDAAHMLATAHDALKLLGLQDRQAVIVQHTDTPHRHVHIAVNMIHPETGESARLYNDEKRLDRWCDSYELKMGVIRSPDRRAKYAAIDQGLKPERKPRQPKRFEQPAQPANDDKLARDRAQALKDGQADYVRRLKDTQGHAWKRRKEESDALWKDYRTARAAIADRHKFAADQIWKHKRNRNALPFSLQGFRDWKQTREWMKLMDRLKAENRRFEYRERTLTGFLANALALVRPGMRQSGRGFLPMLFSLLVSGKARRRLFLVRQSAARQALSAKHTNDRRTRAEAIRHLRDAQMETLARAYDLQKQALDRRHAEEIEAQKQAWRDLAKERNRLWAEWQAEFGQTIQRQKQRNTTDIPGQPEAPSTNRTAWKKRRTADERKRDGSYKPRQRRGPTPSI